MGKFSIDTQKRWLAFINGEYLKFRGGSCKGITDFTAWLDIPQPIASQHMMENCHLPTGSNIIGKMVAKLGFGVSEALGIDPLKDSIATLPEIV